MLKNNIQIKIGNEFVEYDDSTAIGITYRAFDFSNIDKIFVNSTNNFSLPKTPHNKKVFEFAESTFSNTGMPYEFQNVKIYVNGASMMTGSMYLESITDRYNIIFAENKEVFEILNGTKLCIPKLNDISQASLASDLANYWNTTVRNEIITKYNPSSAQDWITSVYKYCIERGVTNSRNEYSPLNDFTIPFVMNNFGEKIPYARIENNEYILDDSKDNNITINYSADPDPSIYSYGFGLNIGRSVDYFDDNDINTQHNLYSISPLWASIDLIISRLEILTGYTFENLANIINGYTGTGNRLFMHLSGIEFDIKPMVFDSSFGWVNDFDGTVTVSSIGDNKDYSFYGSTGDLTADMLTNKTCLDLIKVIMQEFNLVVDIDSINKRLIFNKFSDVFSSQSYELDLYTENEKKFTIDGIKQKQCISYEGNTEDVLKLKCENVNIDEGDYSTSLFTINRYMYYNKLYKILSSTIFGRTVRDLVPAPDFTTVDTNTGITLAIPTNSIVSPNSVSMVCISSIFFSSPDTHPGYASYGTKSLYANYRTQSNQNEQFNTLRQPNCSTYFAYDHLQAIILKPQVLKMDVKLDEVFLHNFTRSNTVTIKGYTGRYYVQEINSYNPRTDEHISLTLIKLPILDDLFDYIPLEYISTFPAGHSTRGVSGYVNTGIVPVDDIEINCKFSYEMSGWRTIFGSENTTNGWQCRYTLTTTDSQVRAQGNDYNFSNVSKNEWHVGGFKSNGQLYLDNTFLTPHSKESNYPIYLFATNRANKLADDTTGVGLKIAEFECIIGGVVQAHMLPVKRKIDSVIGFYDTIRHSFHPIVGRLLAGPEK